MSDLHNTNAIAQRLLHDRGPTATAFAHARAMECLFYQDTAGMTYWDAVEQSIRCLRVAD